MPNVNPEGNDGSLTLEEAANAYANPETDEETGNGQAEDEQEAQDDVEDSLEGDEDDNADDEGQAEDETEDDDEPPAPAYVAPEAKVKLQDGSEVTVAELIQGNLRDRDYRQKTEAVAAERRAYTAKSEQIQQFEQQLAADRDFVIELTQSLMPQKPDPSMCMVGSPNYDPISYAEQKGLYDARKEHLDYLIQVKQHLSQKAAADQQESLKEIRDREWRATLEKMPELKDSTRLQSFVAEVNRVGTEAYGFTNAELQNISLDHRQAVVLRDAIAWRKLQESKSKVAAKVEGRPPVQRGGTRQSAETRVARDAKVAMDRLKSSGSLRDGVAALLAMEKG